MDIKNDTTIQFFDIAHLPQEEQNDFLEDVGELVMQKVLYKTWDKLTNGQKDELTALLEVGGDEEGNDKQNAVFEYLDQNVPDIHEIVQKELFEIENTFCECRDEMLDAIE